MRMLPPGARLFPFPALDGGRLVFLLFEIVTRRRPDERLQAIATQVGFVALLLLMTCAVATSPINTLAWRVSKSAPGRTPLFSHMAMYLALVPKTVTF